MSTSPGFLYLVAVKDWATRKVLTWRVSNTMERDFCVEALKEALVRHGRAGSYNTDQSRQFNSYTKVHWSGPLGPFARTVRHDPRGLIEQLV